MIPAPRQTAPDLPPFASEWPRASIIIVAYRTAGRYIRNCLDALRRLDYPDHEILVVDNASPDDSLQVIRAEARDEIVIASDKNRGFSGGCNLGIAQATGEVIVLLNFDTEVDPAWLRELIRPMRQAPRVAITGSKAWFPGRKIIQHGGGILHPNGMGEHQGYRQEDRGQCDEMREADFVTGASLAVRRAFLDQIGGKLDEDYYPAYLEDVDLCYKAHLRGYRVLYCPASTLVHHESPVLENQSPAFLRLLSYMRLVFCIKNYRLRDWVFRFAPFEVRWMLSPHSKGHRRRHLPVYLDALKFLLGKRHGPDRPYRSA